MRNGFHHRAGISRAEVVVGFVLLALALCLIPPAIQRSREAARRTACQQNLKQLGLGFLQAEHTTGLFPAGTVVREGLPPEKRLSWYVGSSNFLLQQQWLVMQMDQPWNSPANLKPMRAFYQDMERKDECRVAFRCFPLSHCPSAPTQAPLELPEFASYVGIAGLGSDAPELPLKDAKAGMWGYDRRTRRKDITAGRAETMFLAETALDNGPWTAGGPPTVRGIVVNRQPLLGKGGQLGGFHPGGLNLLLVDGSVRFTSDAIDPAILADMLTIHALSRPRPTSSVGP